MSNRIFDAELDKIQLHPITEKVYKSKNIEGLKLTMNLLGQLQNAIVVQQGDFYQILDGASRFHAAKELKWKTLKVELLDLTEKEIQDQLVLRNFKTKRSISELCNHAELILGILGKSQGKRRERIGDLSSTNEDYSLAGKDRFEIACEIVGCEISASTLRKLLAVKEFEDTGDIEIKGFGLIDKIESGLMTINQAHEKVKSFKSDKSEQGKNSLTAALDYVEGNHFKLYNKTCEDLSDINDDSIDCSVQSSPYFQMREFPDGTKPEGVIPHGREETVDEYVKKQVDVFKGIYPKIKETGSLFIVMADSYKGSHCMMTHKFVIAMVDAGWHFVDEWIWKKRNPKPQAVNKRLLPAYEKILHFVKDPQKYYFKEFINWLPEQEFEIVRGKKVENKKESGWSLKRPIERFRTFLDEQHVSKIIETSVYNWAELRDIDPKFRHLAPFPAVLPLLPILMTSKPGDTILDVYSGTSTTAAVALALGRNAIGYDTDTSSHEFSKKRLDLVEKNLPSIQEVIGFENEFMKNEENQDKSVA
jgi:DNA modification methylase